MTKIQFYNNAQKSFYKSMLFNSFKFYNIIFKSKLLFL